MFDLSNSELSVGFFETLKMFYPPKGRLLAECRLQRGPFVFTYVLFYVRICVRKRIFDFQKGRWNMRILKILRP